MEQIFLSEKELAERWRLRPNTLTKWRHEDRGPKYLKIEGKILYRIEDIEDMEKCVDKGVAKD